MRHCEGPYEMYIFYHFDEWISKSYRHMGLLKGTLRIHIIEAKVRNICWWILCGRCKELVLLLIHNGRIKWILGFETIIIWFVAKFYLKMMFLLWISPGLNFLISNFGPKINNRPYGPFWGPKIVFGLRLQAHHHSICREILPRNNGITFLVNQISKFRFWPMAQWPMASLGHFRGLISFSGFETTTIWFWFAVKFYSKDDCITLLKVLAQIWNLKISIFMNLYLTPFLTG